MFLLLFLFCVYKKFLFLTIPCTMKWKVFRDSSEKEILIVVQQTFKDERKSIHDLILPLCFIDKSFFRSTTMEWKECFRNFPNKNKSSTVMMSSCFVLNWDIHNFSDIPLKALFLELHFMLVGFAGNFMQVQGGSSSNHKINQTVFVERFSLYLFEPLKPLKTSMHV